MHRMPIRVLAFLVCLLVLMSGAPTRAVEGPPLAMSPAALEGSLACPGPFDDAAHEPVLLVHGTFVNGRINWSWGYIPALESLGFDVCTVDLPNNGLDDVQVASEVVVHAVRRIAEMSGEKVDVLGVSQGGIEPRWAVKWWPDVQASVDDLVMLATPNHGSYSKPRWPMQCFPSCWQMARGSNFLAALNRTDETPGAVSYTSIYTLFDELVSPIPDTTSALAGASNILIQDVCPGRPVDHLFISGDAVAYALALDAFTHPGPADPARFDPTTCQQIGMPGNDPSAGWDPVMDELTSGGPTFRWVPAEPALKSYAR